MRANRSFALTMALFGLAGLAGLGAVIWGHTRQVYRVPYEEASVAFMKWCTAEPDIDPVAGERYLALFGDRYSWLDLGFGILATALAGLLLVGVLHFSRPDWPWFRTPSRRWHFMVAGWAVLGWTYLSAVYSLEADLERRLFPWCADSIAILIFELGIFTTALVVVCTIAGLALMLCFGRLPTRLDQWNHERPRLSLIVTAVAVVSGVVCGALMAEQASVSMSIANPAGLVVIYLLASTRAALLAPKTADE